MALKSFSPGKFYKSNLYSTLIFFALLCSCAPSRAPIPPGHIPPAQQISLEDEKIGHELLQQLSQDHELDFDHPRRGEVDEIVLKITDAIGASSQPWHVNVFKAPGVKNAAATKGNHIFIWTGMIDATKNKDELAAILGHEVAHILARHTDPTSEEIWRKVLVEGLSMAAGIGVVIATKGAQGADVAADLASSLTRMAGQGIFVNPYSQDKELEADQVGLALMAKAGYRPEAAIEFWERALQDPDFSSSIPFLSTHPPASTRLERLKGLILMMNNGSMSHTPLYPAITPQSSPPVSKNNKSEKTNQSPTKDKKTGNGDIDSSKNTPVQASPLPPSFRPVPAGTELPKEAPKDEKGKPQAVILKDGDSFDINNKK